MSDDHFPPSIHLSDDEIAELCRPLRQPAAQVRYLESIGIIARRRPDGTVLVFRHHVTVQAQNRVRLNGPQWSSL